MDSHWGFALTCIIHIGVFEEQLTGTGQLTITVDAFLAALQRVGITSLFLSSSFVLSLQRKIATRSRLEHPVKTEVAPK